MIHELCRLYSSEEKLILWLNEMFNEKQQKLLLFEITTNANNCELAKKYKVDSHFIVFCRQHLDTFSHHVISSVLKREQQKEEPVRLWYCRVA